VVVWLVLRLRCVLLRWFVGVLLLRVCLLRFLWLLLLLGLLRLCRLVVLVRVRGVLWLWLLVWVALCLWCCLLRFALLVLLSLRLLLWLAVLCLQVLRLAVVRCGLLGSYCCSFYVCCASVLSFVFAPFFIAAVQQVVLFILLAYNGF
jgi:hypothetical protein